MCGNSIGTFLQHCLLNDAHYCRRGIKIIFPHPVSAMTKTRIVTKMLPPATCGNKTECYLLFSAIYEYSLKQNAHYPEYAAISSFILIVARGQNIQRSLIPKVVNDGYILWVTLIYHSSRVEFLASQRWERVDFISDGEDKIASLIYLIMQLHIKIKKIFSIFLSKKGKNICIYMTMSTSWQTKN